GRGRWGLVVPQRPNQGTRGQRTVPRCDEHTEHLTASTPPDRRTGDGIIHGHRAEHPDPVGHGGPAPARTIRVDGTTITAHAPATTRSRRVARTGTVGHRARAHARPSATTVTLVTNTMTDTPWR